MLRPNAVGDFVFALPALHALKAAYPDAELVLVGKPWHDAFLRGRPGPVDRVAVIPPVPGVGAPPESAADDDAVAGFVAAMRAERFDLALQVYGSGRFANPFLQRFGAHVTAGHCGADAVRLDRWAPFREPAQRRLALLEVAGLVGAWPGPLPMATPSASAASPASPSTRPSCGTCPTRPGATSPR